MEGHHLNPDRVDEEELGERMAYAGNKGRTRAAEHRAEAKALESPRTFREHVVKLALGKKNVQSSAEEIRKIAASADKAADSKEEIIMIDVRNRYENDIGRFKNAISLNIDVHKKFPSTIKILSKYKNKKIVTYCTGGIRCEKAFAYFKEYGYNIVFQQKGL